MKTGFKNLIGEKEGKKVKNPWGFEQPPYDERTACYVNAGTHYGVGHKTPTGKFKPSEYAVPMGRPKTMEDDKIHSQRSTNVEVDEE